MSGIAGIVRLDSDPVDRADVDFLAARIAHRGPDGVGCWRGDGIALVQALLVATPEAASPEPLADGAGYLRLAFDGRLDNRDELIGALAGPVTEADSDARLLLRAYERWGLRCVTRISGDFAFALWDGRRRLLFCARDRLGVKPFVYRVEGRRLVWASDLEPLANLPGATRRPNLGMVAEFLANQVTSRSETVWEGVYRLPPAHTLTVRAGRVSVARYWDVDPSREIRHSSHEEYAEHLRDVLTSAVRVRLRSAGLAVPELSGGIDSSAIVGIASGRLGQEGMRAVSLTYPGRDCDESTHIDAVARHCGLRVTKVTPSEAGSFDYVEEARRTAEVPAYPAIALWRRVYSTAKELGASSTLNGVGGDEWLTGTRLFAADLLRAGRLRELAAFARAAARRDSCSPAAAVWNFGARPWLAHALPEPVTDGLRSRLAMRRAPWIRPEFARSVALGDRLRAPARPGLATIAQGEICRRLDEGVLIHSLEYIERFAAGFGLELRLPFLDPRVLDFAMAVPEAERRGDAHPKRVLRAAVRGLIPESVETRLDKQGPTYILAEELLSPSKAACLRSPVAEREGWVDGDQLRSMHSNMRRAAPEWGPHLWPLWRSVAVELWLEGNRLA